MRNAHSAPAAPIDAALGGVLLANMLARWLDSNPEVLSTAETADESENYRASPEQTSLHLPTPVNAGASKADEQKLWDWVRNSTRMQNGQSPLNAAVRGAL